MEVKALEGTGTEGARTSVASVNLERGSD